MNKRAYSASLFPVLLQNFRDHLGGQSARAHARMGRVHPPEGGGKLLWIRAGSSFESVKLGAQLVGSIHAKRLDLRIVFTFENEHVEAFKYELDELDRLGIGYGPCDRPSAISRFLDRMNPFAVVLAGNSPGDNLLHILSARESMHCITVHSHKLSEFQIEAQYPYWGQEVANQPGLQRASELLSLLVQNQLEPTLRNVLHGSAADAGYFWLHTSSDEVVTALQQWQAHELSKKYTLVFSVQGQGPFCIEDQDVNVNYDVQLSVWNRNPVRPGSIIWLDSWAWVGAVAVSSIGNWLQVPNRWVYWQALAASQPMLTGFKPLTPNSSNDMVCGRFPEVLGTWKQWQDATVSTRALRDQCRRQYWESRRQSMATLEAILQRVYDW